MNFKQFAFSVTTMLCASSAAYAVSITPGYTSSTIAIASPTVATGDQFAAASSGTASSTAATEGTVLRATSGAAGVAGSAYALADFTQQFMVTAAGQALFLFTWDGQLAASGGGSSAMYFEAYVPGGEPLTYLQDQIIEDYRTLGPGNSTVDTFGTLSYVFGDSDIGNIISLFARLQTWATTSSEGSLASANFFDTAQLEFHSNNMTPVPLPGAVWLLGSALVGFAGWRRLQLKAAA